MLVFWQDIQIGELAQRTHPDPLGTYPVTQEVHMLGSLQELHRFVLHTLWHVPFDKFWYPETQLLQKVKLVDEQLAQLATAQVKQDPEFAVKE